ncbi:MAG: hypothetical protein ABIY55_27280, partial [Kofleriaceae bacterium]
SAAVWSRRRWRLRALRGLARARRRGGRAAGLAIRIGVPLGLGILIVRGCRDDRRPTGALALGHGARATASVEARLLGEDWQPCDYLRMSGAFHCDGLVTAYDATASLLNDAAPSWGFVTPAIVASADTAGVEIRVRVRARLDGTYAAAVSEGSVELATDDEPARTFERGTLDYADRGERTIELRAAVPTTWWAFTLVREDTIVPDRSFLAGPPDEAPAEVRAIH